jgi:ribonuclease Z
MLGLYFLGTSSGVPTKERNVSGIALKLPETKSWILVDCGEGTQHQILNSPLSLLALKAIFITHVHGDHCYCLPGLLASAGMSGRTDSLLIVAPKEVEQMFLAVKDATDLHLPYEVEFTETSSESTYKVDDIKVMAIGLSHRVPSHAFCFDASSTKHVLNKEKLIASAINRGPLWGEIQKGDDITLDDGRVIRASDYLDVTLSAARVIVAGDNDDPSLLFKVARDADVLVHESTYTQEILEKVGSGPQHSSALKVAEFAGRCRIKNLVLTHFSARYHSKNDGSKNSIDEVRLEAERAYSGSLFLANDHDELVLSDNGKLALS